VTAVDGDPLTGDPGAADVRHLLDIVKGVKEQSAKRVLLATIPVIHEPCGVGQCGGCSSRGCVTRHAGPTPVEFTPRLYESDGTIDGNQC
jgi:hypothetical protein